MNKKIVIILLVSCFAIGSLIAIVLNMEKNQDNQPDDPVVIPSVIKGNGVDTAMKENIFNLLSEPNESLDTFVSLDENGVRIYNWQNIEVLLHKAPEDMNIDDYVILIQILQGMTTVNPDNYVSNTTTDGIANTDYKTLEQFVQKGCDENGLTLTLANICALYKEWVENILVAPQALYLFVGLMDKEEIILKAYFKAEMLKAGILNGFLLGDSEMVHRKEHIPEITVNYHQDNSIYHTIQIGDQTVKVYIFRGIDTLYIKDQIYSPTLNVNKKEEITKLRDLADAYAIGSVLVVSEDYTVQMIRCFNDTELEIRARAFGNHMYETNETTKGDTKYLDISSATLKAQLEANGTSDLIKEYMEWYYDPEKKLDIYEYKLRCIFDTYKNNNPEARKLYHGKD